MTRCLLDTNAFSEIITQGPRISDQALGFVDSFSEVLLSAITFFEIGQKVRLGKWNAMAPHVGRLEEQVRSDGYRVIALSSGLALKASLLDWVHRDPFDRMIAAVAMQEQVPVVSSDAVFETVGVERVW